MNKLINTTSTPFIKCQACGSKNLASILFVGYIPPVNTMPEIGMVPEEQPSYPLEMLRCNDCTLVQIGLDVDPEVLFPPTYPYLSASTKILRENFAQLEKEASETIGLCKNDLVVDFGSNDGTLLGNFKDAGYKVLGIEPTQAGDKARDKGINTLTAYFGLETSKIVVSEYGAAKLITAANVFAHITNVDGVIEGILGMLDTDGVFISENHYLGGLVETLQYDTIYHEHLRYYSVGSLKKLFARHGMEIFKVTKIPTHGGSIRVYACRKGQNPIDLSVNTILDEEDKKGLTDGSILSEFHDKVVQSKLDLMKLLSDIKRDGAKIYGIGAPSRASTLINYVGLDADIIDCVMEISSSRKLNKYIPGTRIPVLDEAKLFEAQPEYALLLSWHITDELVSNLRKKGYKGKFISPLPTPRIIS